MYRILFIHKMFPGQFQHLAAHLALMPGVEVTALADCHVAPVAGVRPLVYLPPDGPKNPPHSYLHHLSDAVRRGQHVLARCVGLNNEGYIPDLIIGHNGWGESLFLKDLWPNVPLVGYFEFFYHAHGADVGFDPMWPVTLDSAARLRCQNAVGLMGLDAVDAGVSPTRWQKELLPLAYQSKVHLLHDGIDTDAAAPGSPQPLRLPDGGIIHPSAKLVTYVARELEPYRGFHVFMRALPSLFVRHPDAMVVIAGGGQPGYGPKPAQGGTWRDFMLAELHGRLPSDRVHFLGKVPYGEFINLMRLSHAHVYLTFPFVLSWSMLESMACGVPLIASDTPPVTEVVRHGIDGMLVPFHDSEALATQMAQTLSMPPDAKNAMRMAARTHVVDRFDAARRAIPAWLRFLHGRFGAPLV